ncbi:MAG: phasin family protein [Pseudomonadota bacterium]
MAKTGNPFLDGDFNNFDVATFFDPKKVAEQMEKFEFGKFAESFNGQAFDTQAVIKSQQKNIEALTAANRVAYEGFQTLVRRQTEIARESFENTKAAVSELSSVSDPQTNFSKQAELLKDAYESAVANYRELAEISVKSNGEAAQVLNARVTESLDELKAQIKAAPKAANGRAKK